MWENVFGSAPRKRQYMPFMGILLRFWISFARMGAGWLDACLLTSLRLEWKYLRGAAPSGLINTPLLSSCFSESDPSILPYSPISLLLSTFSLTFPFPRALNSMVNRADDLSLGAIWIRYEPIKTRYPLPIRSQRMLQWCRTAPVNDRNKTTLKDI